MSYQPLQADQDNQAYYPHNPSNPAPVAPNYGQPAPMAPVGSPQYAMPYVAQPQLQQGYVPPQGYVAPQPQGGVGAYQPVYQQPMNVPQGYVAVPVNPSMVQFQQPGVVVAYNGMPQPQPGMWLDGLCDCFNDAVSCLLSWCLPCIRQAFTLDRARLLDFWMAIFMFAAWYITWIVLESVAASVYGPNSHVIWPGMVIMSVGLVYVFIRTYYRGKLRQKYQIAGSTLEDCLVHWCCSCCAIAQEGRHVDRVEMQGMRV